MALIITEEERMLKSSASEFLKEKAPVSALRQLRDERNPDGLDRNLWNEMSSLGWSSLIVPEELGGLGFGYVGLGQVLEESGRTLTASPLFSTALLCTTALIACGDSEIQNTYLPGIIDGSSIWAFAHDEGNQHTNEAASTVLTSGKLTGKKVAVRDGHIADWLIVSTGNSLVVVDVKSNGISREKIEMMDSLNYATIQFDHVSIEVELTGSALDRVLDIGRVGLAAEMLGIVQESFDRAMNYLRSRKQFGTTLGSFQALQHRSAKMFCEIELCKSIVLKALQAIDENSGDFPILAAMAKSKLGETAKLVTAEAVQMFGGIGVTDDEEIGFFLKRARAAQVTFGDFNIHLNRYAEMKGY